MLNTLGIHVRDSQKLLEFCVARLLINVISGLNKLQSTVQCYVPVRLIIRVTFLGSHENTIPYFVLFNSSHLVWYQLAFCCKFNQTKNVGECPT